MKDLVVLVEGKADEKVFEALLRRPQSFGIRAVEFEIYAHPQSGAGCLNEAVAFFRAIDAVSRYQHALVVFDREGCGRDDVSATDLESVVVEELEASGWSQGHSVLVKSPRKSVISTEVRHERSGEILPVRTKRFLHCARLASLSGRNDT